MDTVKSQIAQILKKRRKEANLRAKDVLEALKSRGIVISDKTLYGWENGYRQPDADTFLVLCEIYGIDSFTEITSQIPEVESENPHFSHEAQQVALAYDRSDKRIQKIVWTALEDFMETPVPAMAKRRTERTAADDSPGMDTWRIRDAYWRETLSQWLKKHPDASISSGDVPEWVEVNMMRAVYEEGLPGWTKEELRERAGRLFEHPWAGQANIVFPSEMNAEAERRRRRKSAGDFSESSGDKTECSSCAQCPLARRCSQRFSEKPFLGLRLGLQVVDGNGMKEPSAVLSDDECPLYNLLKRTAPKSASGEQILLDENGKPLLTAGDIDLRAVLSMMNPAFQSELAKALNPSGDNGDDSEKA